MSSTRSGLTGTVPGMVLTLMLTLAALPPVAPRPDGAVAKPVAQVVIGSGEVTVTPEKDKTKAFKVLVGTPLQASDRVKVAPGAWVVLAILSNEQVVRLDDDLELKVGELALMGAPKAQRTIAEQLETLATVSERSAAERLIGWHASQAGASAPSVESTRRSRDEPKKAKASVDGKKSDDGFVSEKEEVKQQLPSTEGGGGRATGTPPPGAPSPMPAAPPAPPPPPPAAAVVPRDVAPLMTDAKLTACVDELVAGWGPRVRKTLGKTLELSSRVNGETVLIRLPLGLPPSACVIAWVNEHRDSVPPTWTKLQVPLSSTPRTNAK